MGQTHWCQCGETQIQQQLLKDSPRVPLPMDEDTILHESNPSILNSVYNSLYQELLAILKQLNTEQQSHKHSHVFSINRNNNHTSIEGQLTIDPASPSKETNISNSAIKEMIEQLQQIIADNNSNTRQAPSTDGSIAAQIKQMEEILLKFIDIKRSIIMDQSSGRNQREKVFSASLHTFKKLSEDLSTEECSLSLLLSKNQRQSLTSLCHRLTDNLSIEENKLLSSMGQLNSMKYLNLKSNNLITEEESQQSQCSSTLKNPQTPGMKISSHKLREKVIENSLSPPPPMHDVPFRQIQEYPFEIDTIAILNRKLRQIQFKDNSFIAVIYKRITDESKINRAKDKLKIRYSMSINESNPRILPMQGPFFLLNKSKREACIMYKQDLRVFEFNKLLESGIQLNELEILLVTRDLLMILQQLERNCVAHKKINQQTIVYSISQQSWVISQFQKSDNKQDIHIKTTHQQVYNMSSLHSPEVASQTIKIKNNQEIYYQISLKAQDVYAVGMLLSKLKIPPGSNLSSMVIPIRSSWERESNGEKVCISSYIIGQLISQDEKERANMKYSSLLSMIEEEINELTSNVNQENKQNNQQITDKTYKDLLQKLTNNTENYLLENLRVHQNDLNYQLTMYVDLLSLLKPLGDIGYIENLCYTSLKFIEKQQQEQMENKKKEMIFGVKQQYQIRLQLAKIMTDRQDYRQVEPILLQMVVRPQDVLEGVTVNQSLKMFLENFLKIVQNNLSARDYLQDILILDQFVKSTSQLITEYEQTLLQVQVFKCLCYFEQGDKEHSQAIFKEISGKLDETQKIILKGLFEVKMDENQIDFSQYDNLKAIEMLQKIQKANRNDTNKYLELELKIVDLLIQRNDLDEALLKLEDILILSEQFSSEVKIDKMILLEKMGDVCHSLGKEQLKKDYLTQAYTIAGTRNDLAAKASIKAKYKEKIDITSVPQ